MAVPDLIGGIPLYKGRQASPFLLFRLFLLLFLSLSMHQHYSLQINPHCSAPRH
jgi:hypothetical protein